MTENAQQAVAMFQHDAQAYCRFIDSWRAGDVVAPYTGLLRLLSSLAKSGELLPLDFPDQTARDLNDVARIDHRGWQTIAEEISQALGPAVNDLIVYHGDDTESAARAWMFYDDLADIYRDLRHGLDLFVCGDPIHCAAAAWEWRFSYESHWGAHLFRALTTVHEVRFLLHEA